MRVFYLAFILLSANCFADATDELVKLISGFSIWQSDFVQSVTDEHGQLIQTTSGRLIAEKPYKLNWQAFEPYPETIISDGSTLWRYDPDLEQVIVETLSTDLQQAPVLIFSGDSNKIRESYQVDLINTNTESSVFQLIPKDDSNLFVSLDLAITSSSILYLSITDSLGQTSRTDFSNFKILKHSPENSFQFNIPEGVEVVSQDD